LHLKASHATAAAAVSKTPPPATAATSNADAVKSFLAPRTGAGGTDKAREWMPRAKNAGTEDPGASGGSRTRENMRGEASGIRIAKILGKVCAVYWTPFFFHLSSQKRF